MAPSHGPGRGQAEHWKLTKFSATSVEAGKHEWWPATFPDTEASSCVYLDKYWENCCEVTSVQSVSHLIPPQRSVTQCCNQRRLETVRQCWYWALRNHNCRCAASRWITRDCNDWCWGWIVNITVPWFWHWCLRWYTVFRRILKALFSASFWI